MSRVLILVAVAGMSCGGGDPLSPELREVVPCIEGGIPMCERACTLEPEPDEARTSCILHGEDGYSTSCADLGGGSAWVVTVDGTSGCCAYSGTAYIARWYECGSVVTPPTD